MYEYSINCAYLATQDQSMKKKMNEMKGLFSCLMHIGHMALAISVLQTPLYFMVYGASIKLVAFTFSGPLPWYPFLWWINLVLEGSFIFFFTTSSCCEVKPMIMVTWMTVEYDSHYTTTAHIIRVPTFAFFLPVCLVDLNKKIMKKYVSPQCSVA